MTVQGWPCWSPALLRPPLRSDGGVFVSGDLDDPARRVSGLTEVARSPRRRGSFRDGELEDSKGRDSMTYTAGSVESLPKCSQRSPGG